METKGKRNDNATAQTAVPGFQKKERESKSSIPIQSDKHIHCQ